jgi:hypothetical protein
VFAATGSTSSHAKNRVHTYMCSMASGEAKFWLEPQVELAADYGLGSTRINAARKILEERVDDVRSAWAKHFGG